MTPDHYISAARVPASVQPGQYGPWRVCRVELEDGFDFADDLLRRVIGFDSQTQLWRHSLATMHKDLGEIVMEDSRRELARHLPIWLAAHGRVLVTGLGLGCVVRGLLANAFVEHITVVEIDRDIIDLIGPEFAGERKVRLIHADALKFETAGERWDFAWHDLWRVDGECLHVWHMDLLMRLDRSTGRQGAWALPRPVKRLAKLRGMAIL